MMRLTIYPRGTWAATGRRDLPSRATVQRCTLPRMGERRCHDRDLPRRPRAVVEDEALGRCRPVCSCGSHPDGSLAVSAAAQAGCARTSIAALSFLPVNLCLARAPSSGNEMLTMQCDVKVQWTGGGPGCLDGVERLKDDAGCGRELKVFGSVPSSQVHSNK